MDLIQIGKRIQQTRKEFNLTQVQLADLASISYRPIYLIEDGKSIRLDTLVKICDALGLTLTLESKGSMTGE